MLYADALEVVIKSVNFAIFLPFEKKSLLAVIATSSLLSK